MSDSNDIPDFVEIKPLHSDRMIRAEAAAMLGDADIAITPGQLMQLWLNDSPFITGKISDITAESLASAREILDEEDAAPEEIIEAIATAIRPFAIIESSPNGSRHADYSGFCPEWLADLYASINEYGAIPWDYFLWKLPMAAAAHLLAASHRRNGGTTARPMDWSNINSLNS